MTACSAKNLAYYVFGCIFMYSSCFFLKTHFGRVKRKCRLSTSQGSSKMKSSYTGICKHEKKTENDEDCQPGGTINNILIVFDGTSGQINLLHPVTELYFAIEHALFRMKKKIFDVLMYPASSLATNAISQSVLLYYRLIMLFYINFKDKRHKVLE